jgi:hypothetical protein
MAEFLFETIRTQGTLPDEFIRVQSDNGKCFVNAEVSIADVHSELLSCVVL